MRNFRNFKVWHKSHELSLDIYKITKGFPDTEKFGITSQIQRASISIEANIAEGCFRSSQKELVYFLHIAGGSASEVDCIIEVAKDLKYINEAEYESLHNKVTEVLKMLSTLIKTIK